MKFKISKCNICGKVDGSIQVIKSYNSKRDELEWSREGRDNHEIEGVEGESFPRWCEGPDEEGE